MDFNPVVVAPTFNNAGTLLGVLSRLDAQGFDIIVVNDGSTDDTAAVLEAWAQVPRAHAAHVMTHEANRGKAAALRMGFTEALRLGHTHALSIDTDGQLSPEQAGEMFALARANPEAMVLGVRDDTAADYPARSRLGRRSANLLIFMECGLRVADSQCGLRVYPLAMEELFRCRAGRYGFETEIIAMAGWAGRAIVESPARCTYFSGTQRVSHFRPWRDSVRAAWMHGRLVGRALLPFGKVQRPVPEPRVVPSAPFWRKFLRWISPWAAWRQLRQDRPEGAQRTAMAGGIAIGSFIGCIPFYGLHSVIALYAARRLNLNPVAMVLGTQVACPPVGIVLAGCAVAVGHMLLHGGIPPPGDFAPIWEGPVGFLKLGRWFLIDWMVGSVLVGIACMFLMFFLSDWLLRRVPEQKASAVAQGA